MKTNIFPIKLLFVFVLTLSFTACNDYLDILPKGERIPTTLSDFEAGCIQCY